MIVYNANEKPIDDGRMLSVENHPFDKKKLVDIYKEISPDEEKHPWKHPENYTGWKRSGWHYPEVNYRHNHAPGVFETNTRFPISDYPYICDICDTFKEEFELFAIWFFHNLKDYSFAVHYDSQKSDNGKSMYSVPNRGRPGATDHQGNTNQVTEKELLPGWTLDHGQKKPNGSMASFNVILSEHWSGDKSPTPVCFTRENQNDLPFNDMYKTDDDFMYYYNAALLNTNWTHYVTMDGVHERLLFRVSLFDNLPFQSAKNKFKRLGLINN